MSLACCNELVFVERKDIPQNISIEIFAIITTRAENLIAMLHAPKHLAFRTLHCVEIIEIRSSVIELSEGSEGSIKYTETVTILFRKRENFYH